jgi:CDP-diacylglycerol--glycerol-3-phosphate 3-phosphatidyltransferase
MAVAVALTVGTAVDYVYRALALRRTGAAAVKPGAAGGSADPTGTSGARTDTAA